MIGTENNYVAVCGLLKIEFSSGIILVNLKIVVERQLGQGFMFKFDIHSSVWLIFLKIKDHKTMNHVDNLYIYIDLNS